MPRVTTHDDVMLSIVELPCLVFHPPHQSVARFLNPIVQIVVPTVLCRANQREVFIWGEITLELEPHGAA